MNNEIKIVRNDDKQVTSIYVDSEHDGDIPYGELPLKSCPNNNLKNLQMLALSQILTLAGNAVSMCVSNKVESHMREAEGVHIFDFIFEPNRA